MINFPFLSSWIEASLKLNHCNIVRYLIQKGELLSDVVRYMFLDFITDFFVLLNLLLMSTSFWDEDVIPLSLTSSLNCLPNSLGHTIPSCKFHSLNFIYFFSELFRLQTDR